MTGQHEPYPVGACGQMIFCRTCEAFTVPGMRYWMRKVPNGIVTQDNGVRYQGYRIERNQEDRYEEGF